MHGDAFGAPDDFELQRIAQQFCEKARTRAADYDLGYVLEAAEAQNFVGKVVSNQSLRLAAKRLRESDRFINIPAGVVGERAAWPFDCLI